MSTNFKYSLKYKINITEVSAERFFFTETRSLCNIIYQCLKTPVDHTNPIVHGLIPLYSSKSNKIWVNDVVVQNIFIILVG